MKTMKVTAKHRRFWKSEQFKAVKVFAISLLVIFTIQACRPFETNAEKMKALRTSDKKIISFEKMVEEIKDNKIIFVGETHSNEYHHRLQLEIIKRLKEKGIPIAVGLEMFTVESQDYLNKWSEGTIEIADFIKIYYRNWNFPWPLYRDVLIYIRENKIPAIGLNLPPEITSKVSDAGFSALTEEERKKLPPETGCIVDERYINFIRRAYAMRGHEGKKFIYFCEAQLLWDQFMARNIVQFLRKNLQKTVIVLTGNGHAWKGGIPSQVSKLSRDILYSVLLPEVAGHIDPQRMSVVDADYILLEKH
ncbi:MAG: ChaN family lipoprotein [Nitrospirota bacterium]